MIRDSLSLLHLDYVLECCRVALPHHHTAEFFGVGCSRARARSGAVQQGCRASDGRGKLRNLQQPLRAGDGSRELGGKRGYFWVKEVEVKSAPMAWVAVYDKMKV